MRERDGWTKVLGSKAKLIRKRYGIVALGIPTTKIDLEKSEETKEKLVTQNASMCTGMKIESLFWLSSSKKDKQAASLVIEVDDAKIANLLIEEGLVLDHTLHGCIRYNPACKINGLLYKLHQETEADTQPQPRSRFLSGQLLGARIRTIQTKKIFSPWI